MQVHWAGLDLRPFTDTGVLPTERGARVLLLKRTRARDPTLSWAGIELADVHRVTPYRLIWTFL